MLGFPDSARNGMSLAAWNWTTDTIKAMAIDLAVFTPTFAMDFRNDVTAGVIAETTVTGKSVGSIGVGTVGHADAVFTSVTGASIEQICYYKDTGVQSTSPLIIWNDQFVQVVPNGTNIGLIAPDGVYQIAQGIAV